MAWLSGFDVAPRFPNDRRAILIQYLAFHARMHAYGYEFVDV